MVCSVKYGNPFAESNKKSVYFIFKLLPTFNETDMILP